MVTTVNEHKYFERIGKAWDDSDIKKKHPEWAWSLAATQLYQDSLVIVGFNWGDDGSNPGPQNELPKMSWNKQDLGSLARTIPYLGKHFKNIDLDKVVQTNYCFFRSPEQSDITPEDIDRCHPIFMDLLKDLQPKQVLIFSSILRDRIKDQLSNKQIAKIPSSDRTAIAIRATWSNGGREIPVGIVPHPNNAISGEAREKCWEWISQ